MKVFHIGRGGYIEYEGYKYNIESTGEGHFCIFFPCGNRHSYLQKHLEDLTKFAEIQEPKWYVENKSKKYKI